MSTDASVGNAPTVASCPPMLHVNQYTERHAVLKRLPPLAFDVQHDDLALDWIGVDGTSILSLIVPLDVEYLQVPLLDVWPNDSEPEVVNYSSIFVRQRY